MAANCARAYAGRTELPDSAAGAVWMLILWSHVLLLTCGRNRVSAAVAVRELCFLQGVRWGAFSVRTAGSAEKASVRS